MTCRVVGKKLCDKELTKIFTRYNIMSLRDRFFLRYLKNRKKIALQQTFLKFYDTRILKLYQFQTSTVIFVQFDLHSLLTMRILQRLYTSSSFIG